jgi:uncharacterized damage-inducible protein DinB
MTLTEIKTLHAYNSWADNQVFELLSPMPEEQYLKDMNSSHGGIHGTMIHLVGAEKVWLERFHGRPQPFLTENPPKSLAELKLVWEKVGYDTAKWIASMNDRKLGETFTMTTTTGTTYTHVFWQAFQHLVNHSSYHRGQVVTLMRQLGAKPPATDLIRFYRETGSGKIR